MRPDKEFRYSSWTEFCDDLAVTLPQVARLGKVRIDNSLFGIVRNLAFFSGFSDEVWETVGISRWQQRKADQQVVEEGEVSSSFYIIIGGEALVTKNGAGLAT